MLIKNHQQILNQIWGNDISHFPATLSVINLYKQRVDDTANFPRVIRNDFFTLVPKQTIEIPDNKDIDKINQIPVPKFDAVVSNFPFIQQEDIPNEILNAQFENEFAKTQNAFLNGNRFEINGKSDYYIYCFYNSLKFLKDNGVLASITSNAWLGKNYGLQFKKFLLDNFHIKYVVKSNAEHWFQDSKVSTIFITLEKSKSKEPTKFITVNEKLENLFANKSFQHFEDFYSEVENCDNPYNVNWTEDNQFKNVFHKTDGTTTVSIVDKPELSASLETENNWDEYFISQNLFAQFENHTKNLYPEIIDAPRGIRTGWDKMYIIPNDIKLPVEKEFLTPYIKSQKQISHLEIQDSTFKSYLFTCDESEDVLKSKYPKAYKWIKKFENEMNTNDTLTIKEKGVMDGHKPYWYSIPPNEANIVTAINPYRRLFFSFSKDKFTVNQRLAVINVKKGNNVMLIAALLNSIVSKLIIEVRGSSRNEGALDLNADYFKKLKILNPESLGKKQVDKILSPFKSLCEREINDFEEEYQEKDRIAFDQEVIKAYGFKTDILPKLYSLLTETIRNRVEMKNR